MPRHSIIINFHGVGPPPRAISASEQRVWLDTSAFERILDRVAHDPRVILTFDDGNVSDYDIVMPALQNRKLSARFFIVADHVGKPGFTSATQIRALAAAGMKIGNHGKRHRNWRRASDSELREELIDARQRLEDLAELRIHEAACPYGSYDRRVLKAVRSASYAKVYTSDDGLAAHSAWVQPRNTVTRNQEVPRILNPRYAGWFPAWADLKRWAKMWR